MEAAWHGVVGLEVLGELHTGFCVGGPGHVATRLLPLLGAASLSVVTPGGERHRVLGVSGVDARRDLVVVHAPSLGHPAPDLIELPRVKNGDQVRCLGIALGSVSAPARRIELAASVHGTQVRDDGLDFSELRFAPGAQTDLVLGGPVLDAEGQPVGVITRARTSRGEVTLALPSRHLLPLIHSGVQLDLSVLSAIPRPRARQVPRHSLTLLEGADHAALQHIAASLIAAVQEGAPAYNRGEAARCYLIYSACSRHLVANGERAPGPTRALRDGLALAETLDSLPERAWALRDSFDGLLEVLEKYFRAQLAFAHRNPSAYFN